MTDPSFDPRMTRSEEIVEQLDVVMRELTAVLHRGLDASRAGDAQGVEDATVDALELREKQRLLIDQFEVLNRAVVSELLDESGG